MKKETKEEAAVAVFGAIFFMVLILLATVLWSPTWYYLGKWGNYWDDTKQSSTAPDEPLKVPDYYPFIATSTGFANVARLDADKTCEKRAMRYFGVTSKDDIYTFITPLKEDYSSYECRAVKLTKLPK